MKRTLLLSLLAALSYASFLLINTPAQFVWEQVQKESYLPNSYSEAQFIELRGTLLSGHAEYLALSDKVYSGLSWALDTKQLLRSKIAFRFTIKNTVYDLTGNNKAYQNKDYFLLIAFRSNQLELSLCEDNVLESRCSVIT